jgi:hypothetical protein
MEYEICFILFSKYTSKRDWGKGHPWTRMGKNRCKENKGLDNKYSINVSDG